MRVYRLSKKKYCNDLSGRGAELAGGRWNHRGTAVVYTSSSRALCTAEIAVHTPLSIMPLGYCLIILEVPDHSIIKIRENDLPVDWNSHPHTNSTQLIGDTFVAEASQLILQVPSVVVQGDYNFILNPAHPEMSKIFIVSTEDFEFDKRLFKRS